MAHEVFTISFIQIKSRGKEREREKVIRLEGNYDIMTVVNPSNVVSLFSFYGGARSLPASSNGLKTRQKKEEEEVVVEVVEVVEEVFLRLHGTGEIGGEQSLTTCCLFDAHQPAFLLFNSFNSFNSLIIRFNRSLMDDLDQMQCDEIDPIFIFSAAARHFGTFSQVHRKIRIKSRKILENSH